MDLTDAPQSYLDFLFLITKILPPIGGLGWNITYITSVYLSLRHHTYGMPLVALCINFAWELVFGLWHWPAGRVERALILFWFILDVGMVYTAIKFSPREWGHTPFMTQRNVALILLLGTGFATWFFMALVAELGADIGMLVGAILAQGVLSVALLAQLLQRASTRGTNWWAWIGRFCGTNAFSLNFTIRTWYWHELNVLVVGPLLRWAAVFLFACDLGYAVVFWRVRREERRMGRDNALAWRTEGTRKRA